MSNIVLETLRQKRQEANEQYEAKLKNLEEQRRELKKFEEHVREMQDTVHELDDAIQREIDFHFTGEVPNNLTF